LDTIWLASYLAK